MDSPFDLGGPLHYHTSPPVKFVMVMIVIMMMMVVAIIPIRAILVMMVMTMGVMMVMVVTNSKFTANLLGIGCVGSDPARR